MWVGMLVARTHISNTEAQEDHQKCSRKPSKGWASLTEADRARLSEAVGHRRSFAVSACSAGHRLRRILRSKGGPQSGRLRFRETWKDTQHSHALQHGGPHRMPFWGHGHAQVHWSNGRNRTRRREMVDLEHQRREILLQAQIVASINVGVDFDSILEHILWKRILAASDLKNRRDSRFERKVTDFSPLTLATDPGIRAVCDTHSFSHLPKASVDRKPAGRRTERGALA